MTTSIYISQDSISLALGADETVQAIATAAVKVGEPIRIIRTGSRGMAWLEPYVEVLTPNGRIGYGPVTETMVDELIDTGLLKGNTEHPLCQGLTEQIPYFKSQQRLTFARVGVIDPLSIEHYESEGGLQGLDRALCLSAQQIIDEIKASGLRGRGGAAFPTGIKWQTVLDASVSGSDKNKYIVCNADEGDSGTFADRMLMEGDPFSLIEGMVIAGLGVGATHGYIYLRSEYPHTAEVLTRAIELAYQQQLLGEAIRASAHAFHLHLRIGAGAYICGEETSMLDSLEGKRGMVRVKPPLPAINGLFGEPTVVNNVITLATVPMILQQGAEHYQQFGQGESRGTLAIQLSGNVAQAGLVELAFGITIDELVRTYGKGSATGRPLRAIQIGGPLGAYLPSSLWQTSLDYESMASVGAMLGHGGLVCFDDTVDMAEQAEFSMRFCAAESCGKCTPCRIGSVRGAETIAKIRRNESRKDNLVLLEDLCETMVAGSLCAMGSLTPSPVRSAVQHFRQDFGDVNDDQMSGADIDA